MQDIRTVRAASTQRNTSQYIVGYHDVSCTQLYWRLIFVHDSAECRSPHGGCNLAAAWLGVTCGLGANLQGWGATWPLPLATASHWPSGESAGLTSASARGVRRSARPADPIGLVLTNPSVSGCQRLRAHAPVGRISSQAKQADMRLLCKTTQA